RQRLSDRLAQVGSGGTSPPTTCPLARCWSTRRRTPSAPSAPSRWGSVPVSHRARTASNPTAWLRAVRLSAPQEAGRGAQVVKGIKACGAGVTKQRPHVLRLLADTSSSQIHQSDRGEPPGPPGPLLRLGVKYIILHPDRAHHAGGVTWRWCTRPRKVRKATD